MKLHSTLVVTVLALGLLLNAPLKSAAQEQNQQKLSATLDKVETLPVAEAEHTLVHAYGESASAVDKAEAAYVLARIYQKSNQPRQMRKAFKLFAEAGKISSLWELSQWHTFELACQFSDERAARKALLAISTGPVSLNSQARASFELGKYYFEHHDLNKARDAFVDLHKNFPNSTFSTEALYYLGEISLHGAQDEVVAIALLHEYLNVGAGGINVDKAIESLSNIPSFKASAADYEQFGRIYYANQEWDKAWQQWSHVPSTRRWYEEGMCLAEMGRVGEASQKLRDGISMHLTDAAVPAAADLLLRLYRYNPAALIPFWQKFPTQGHAGGDAALWSLASLTGGVTSLSYCQSLVDQYPQSGYEPNASYRLFMHALRLGNNREALKVVQLSLSQHPHSVYAPRFAFWCGKIHEALQEPVLAAQAYQMAAADFPCDYYGYRSKGRLAALNGGIDPAWSTQKTRKHPDPAWSWPDPASQIDATRVDPWLAPTLIELSKLHQWDECLALSPSDQVAFKSSLLARMNKPLEAINSVAQTLSGGAQHDHSWTLAYPLAYARAIDRESTADSVDPLLIHSLIRQESRYMDDARSHSGAIGLMQLMPATAHEVARSINLPLYGQMDIYKTDNNVKMGTWYIAHVIDQFQGNTMFAVAGYNGGPGAVSRWYEAFKQAGMSDLDLFAEVIPKDETRDYVKKVFENYWNYQEIYK